MLLFCMKICSCYNFVQSSSYFWALGKIFSLKTYMNLHLCMQIDNQTYNIVIVNKIIVMYRYIEISPQV